MPLTIRLPGDAFDHRPARIKLQHASSPRSCPRLVTRQHSAVKAALPRRPAGSRATTAANLCGVRQNQPPTRDGLHRHRRVDVLHRLGQRDACQSGHHLPARALDQRTAAQHDTQS